MKDRYNSSLNNPLDFLPRVGLMEIAASGIPYECLTAGESGTVTET